MATVTRDLIADYFKVSDAFVLMGTGFNTLDENPNAQTDSKTYINDRSATSVVKGYQTQFPFDSDFIASEAVIKDIYEIGSMQKTGSDAEREYIRVDLFDKVGTTGEVYKARKFRVSVEVSSFAGAGGETIKISGNLNNVGSMVAGTFDLATKTFTEN